jgi:hypothetical protein
MITQLDIQRTAKIMIDQHGEDALFEAMDREHQFLYKNDTQGAHLWHRITNTIEWMTMPEALAWGIAANDC